MDNLEILNHTKKRLTLIFTLIVLFMAFVLEGVYFSYKFIYTNTSEKTNFESLVDDFNTNLLLDGRFPSTFNRNMGDSFNKFLGGRNIFGRGDFRGNNINRDMLPNLDNTRDGRFLNFILYNKSGEILSYNINHEIEDENITSGIFGAYFTKIRTLEGDQGSIVFFKKKLYSFSDYIRDILIFLVFDIFFGVIFYIIGSLFVSKNLALVESTILDLNDFIHSASHELKTPLSVVSSNLQLVDKLESYDRELIHNSKDEIDKIDKLIEGLLSLSNIDKNTKAEDIKLGDIIDDSLLKYSKLIEDKNIRLTKNYHHDITINANPSYIDIFISNIISNAIRYNTEDGFIEITLKDNICTISNSGDLISKADEKKIFNRFYKIDSSRNSKGYGLGLSIVKKISEIYNWSIELKTIEDRNVFRVRFM